MADEQGFYRSDGIQNSGTGLKSGRVNCEIYNSSKKIYPREETRTLNGDSAFGSFSLGTYRNNNRGWKNNCAYQGAKSIGFSSNCYVSWGHIIPASIPRYDNLLAVEYVRIGYVGRATVGIFSRDRTLVLNTGLNDNDIPALGNRCDFTYPANWDRGYHTADSNDFPALNDVFFQLLKSGTRLVLHNDETSIITNPTYSDGTGYGSPNYAALNEFKVEEIRVKYQP